MTGDPRWLDEHEMTAWRALVEVAGRLFERLDRELQTAHDLSLGDYEVLHFLSNAPDERLRMSELADVLLFSRSRLTHHVNRLEREELVTRVACPTDRRGSFAVLTAKGRRRLTAAAPTHVRGVREHFFDLLDDQQVAALGEALPIVADHLAKALPIRT